MKLATYFQIADTNFRQLALEVGVDPSTMHRYMSGSRIPSLKIAIKIEDATDGEVTVRDLLGEENGDQPQALPTEG